MAAWSIAVLGGLLAIVLAWVLRGVGRAMWRWSRATLKRCVRALLRFIEEAKDDQTT